MQFGRASGMAAKILRCQQFNKLLGLQVAPWELDALPDEWLVAVETWVTEYPRVTKWFNESRESLESLRKGRGRRVQ